MKRLGEIGEHEAIRRLVRGLGGHSELVVGAGDDCAVARFPGSAWEQVFTTDPVVESVHFLASHAPERVGNKAVGRVLSDIAAMGAQPQWLLVNVVAPESLEIDFLERVYAGMTALSQQFGATIIGGDLAQGRQLELHVFGTGILPAGTALLRSGARVGESIYVTGALGGSIAGKHLDFVPRVGEGIFLRESGVVGAMMDVSDGLATDLRHICAQSGVGAELDAELIPKNGTLAQALFDGEDFELLFTARDADFSGWETRFCSEPPRRIGCITDCCEQLRLRLVDGALRVLEGKAFEHFS